MAGRMDRGDDSDDDDRYISNPKKRDYGRGNEYSGGKDDERYDEDDQYDEDGYDDDRQRYRNKEGNSSGGMGTYAMHAPRARSPPSGKPPSPLAPPPASSTYPLLYIKPLLPIPPIFLHAPYTTPSRCLHTLLVINLALVLLCPCACVDVLCPVL